MSKRTGRFGLGLAGLLVIAPAVLAAPPAALGQVSQPSKPGQGGLGFAYPAAPSDSDGAAAPGAEAAWPARLGRGEIYAYTRDGATHYSNQRPRDAEGIGPVTRIRYTYIETCFACGIQPDVDFGSVRLNTEAYQREITNAARDFGVDEAVVRAVIHAESAYNPNAISRVGAQGLMQLMPATARRFGVANVFDIGQNIRGGVQYLAWLLKRFNGNLTLAAAGYNAGEGAVDRFQGVPPYNETQRYVQRVALLAQRYRTARPHEHRN